MCSCCHFQRCQTQLLRRTAWCISCAHCQNPTSWPSSLCWSTLNGTLCVLIIVLIEVFMFFCISGPGCYLCVLLPVSSRRVAEKEPINKMSLHNLATVFGPTLLRPSESEITKGQHITSASDIWSHDVMAQVHTLTACLSLTQSLHMCETDTLRAFLDAFPRCQVSHVTAVYHRSRVSYMWMSFYRGVNDRKNDHELICTRTPIIRVLCCVSPQVQVLLYYLQHSPISFAELKRNTLYFSTDV